jgi:hypothetical protein
MNCVFAHACYGVILSDEEHQMLQQKLVDAEEIGFPDAEDMRDNMSSLLSPELLTLLRRKYQAPTADLHYTGSEDEHMSGSATGAETFILGYGCLAFPGAIVPKNFQEHAQWHFWVTSEV